MYRTGHLLNLQTGQLLLVAQHRVLQRDHIEIRINPGLIPAHLQIQSRLRRRNRPALLLDLLRKDTCLRQRVLYLLEGGQHRLPVAGNVRVVNGDVLMEFRL